MGKLTTTPRSSGRYTRSLVIWVTLFASIVGISLLFSMMPLFGKVDTQVGVVNRSETTTTGRGHKANEFVQQEPFSIDHSILNNPNLLPEPNPSPMAIAAYD